MQISVTVKEFRTHLEVCGYAKSTIHCYLQYLSYFIDYLIQQKIDTFKQVNQQDIKNYQLIVADMNLADETIALRMRPVRKIFSWLVESHRLLINPTDSMKKVSGKGHKLPPVLTIDEMRLLLEQPNPSLPIQLRDRAVMETLYSSAIRLNELVNLELNDINLKEKEIIVRKGKGGHQRVVPIGTRAAEYIKQYLLEIRPLHAKKNNNTEQKLFLTDVGNPITGNTIRTFLFRYKRNAGIIKTTSPHSFRRSCATHLIQRGADIRYVQQLLGHRKLRTTQLYTRIYPTDLKTVHNMTHPTI